MTTAIQPGDRIRLPHWPRYETAAKTDKDAVWLNDNRGGTWRYKLGRKWIKDDGKPVWLQHKGGVAPTTASVEVRLRDGRVVELPASCKPDWEHTGAMSDILEWRGLV